MRALLLVWLALSSALAKTDEQAVAREDVAPFVFPHFPYKETVANVSSITKSSMHSGPGVGKSQKSTF